MDSTTLGFDDSYEIFPDNVRIELFIKIRRTYIQDTTWRNWPKSTKAIVPVIMKHSNICGYSFPSQTRIAIYSGITEKSVREGLNGLQNFQDFGITKEFSRRGWMKNKYWFKPASRNEKGAIFISHAFFNGANWARLTSSAKAIYPVLKCYCFWELERYQEYVEIRGSPLDVNYIYKYRNYDFLSAEPEAIAEFSGICKKSIPSAFQSLTNNYFIEPIGMVDGRKTYKIYTRPPRTFKAYMNKQARKRYNLNENFTY